MYEVTTIEHGAERSAVRTCMRYAEVPSVMPEGGEITALPPPHPVTVEPHNPVSSSVPVTASVLAGRSVSGQNLLPQA